MQTKPLDMRIALGVIGAIVAILGLLVWNIVAQVRRRKALRTLAPLLGLSYTEQDTNFEQRLQFGKSLFPNNESRRAEALMEGTVAGLRAAIFDFVYMVTDQARNQAPSMRSVTVAAFASAPHQLPVFELKRKGLFSGITRHANFEGDPEFAEHFAVTGPDLEAIQRTFNPQVTHALTAAGQKDLHVSGEGQWLVFWANKRPWSADEWRDFLERSSRIASEFFGGAQRS
jgi:hypothetical protein